MKKIYSLVLMESVVDEIDKLASKENTNRSNMINQILAEYVSLTTPEKKINNIFNTIEEIVKGKGIFETYIAPNEYTMSLKSPLAYKYRPTIKYEIELFRTPSKTIGSLKVIYRTQYVQLLMELMNFFKLMMNIENHYLEEYTLKYIDYTIDENRFVRSIVMPSGQKELGNEISRAISRYILMIDELMKKYLQGEYDEKDIEKRYLDYISQGEGII